MSPRGSGYLLPSPVRCWLGQDPFKILSPYVREGMTALELAEPRGHVRDAAFAAELAAAATGLSVAERPAIKKARQLCSSRSRAPWMFFPRLAACEKGVHWQEKCFGPI
jgi:hypothetical protein